MPGEVLRDGKLERGRVRGELELAGLAERVYERRVQEKGLHGEAGEVESPASARERSQDGVDEEEEERRRGGRSTHHSLAKSPTRYDAKISSLTSASLSTRSVMYELVPPTDMGPCP